MSGTGLLVLFTLIPPCIVNRLRFSVEQKITTFQVQVEVVIKSKEVPLLALRVISLPLEENQIEIIILYHHHILTRCVIVSYPKTEHSFESFLNWPETMRHETWDDNEPPTANILMYLTTRCDAMQCNAVPIHMTYLNFSNSPWRQSTITSMPTE